MDLGGHLPIMRVSRRPRSAVCWTLMAFFAVFSCSWFLLYLDSVHQRRRAERLLLDLKSFPFASAGFLEVRHFATGHGGIAIQQFPLVRFSPPRPPFLDERGQVQSPLIDTAPTCTDQDCTFEIWIKPYFFTFPYSDRATLLWSGLAHSGLRPWVLHARFEVKHGELWESHTAVGQLRHDTLRSSEGLVPLGYEIVTRSMVNARDRHQTHEYGVGVPVVTGSAVDILTAQVAQLSDASIRRAFDIDLHCLTVILHSCRGLSELAPSAWRDYEASENAFRGEMRQK
jgi:hypothetical protein